MLKTEYVFLNIYRKLFKNIVVHIDRRAYTENVTDILIEDVVYVRN